MREPRWKRYAPWAGRHFETLPEVAMHVGIWFLFASAGWYVGAEQGVTAPAFVLFGIGAVIGGAGQIVTDFE